MRPSPSCGALLTALLVSGCTLTTPANGTDASRHEPDAPPNDAGKVGDGGGFEDAGELGDASLNGDASDHGDAGLDASLPCSEDLQDVACGLNGRGHFVGGCGAPRRCVDPDVCEDTSVDVRTCGLNGRGSQQRVCGLGKFGDWSACDDADECLDGDDEAGACGLNGTGTRDRACVNGRFTDWSSCVDASVCVNTSIERRDCGFNVRGSQDRSCVHGQFGAWSKCEDPDVCRDGVSALEACGINGRGTRERMCVSGAWSDWSRCSDDDMCRDADVESRACGLNGRGIQSRACTSGSWGEFGTCVDSDQCKDGAQQTDSCGLNGTGTRDRVCVNGRLTPWSECVDDSKCVNASVEQRACGFNTRGEQARTCANGQFGEWTQCVDPDVCRDGALNSETCGLNARGTRDRSCVGGAWSSWSTCRDADKCVDEATEERACGTNGRGHQERTCANGQWTDFASCVDPYACDVCEHDSICSQDGGGVHCACIPASGYEGPTCAEETAHCSGNDVCAATGLDEYYPCIDTLTSYVCRGRYADWPMPGHAPGSPYPARYTSNLNVTVTDEITGLEWQQFESEPMFYVEAQAYCENLTVRALSDWRLPSKIELESIIDETRFKPAIASAMFQTREIWGYNYPVWTSSPVSVDINIYVVYFETGNTTASYRGNEGKARCVRGGHLVGSTPHRYDTSSAQVVLDRQTGLVWQAALAPAPLGWADAAKYCEALVLGDQDAFHLPAVKELATIVDPFTGDSVEPFAKATSEWIWLWSASAYAAQPADNAWAVRFGRDGNNSGSDPRSKTTEALGVRCVR